MANKKKKGVNIPSLIITVIAVILAVGAIIFVVITMNPNKDSEPDATESTTEATIPAFQATQELVDETQQAAYDLLPENYKIFQYLTRGMTHEEEPYGNLPEDGFYTCVSDDFQNFDEFSEYVRSVYVKETAEKLLTDPFGSGPVYGVDDTGALGLSSSMTPDPTSGSSWANVQFVCTPVSETLCDITITLKDASDNDVIKDIQLIFEDGKWKLSEMVG